MDISVVIPCYNRPEWSVRAIKSVIDQSYKNWQLIVIDDGSTDNTYERISSYLESCDDITYTLVKTPNLGVSHARNLGIKLSESPYISFLDCDDEWLPHKLESQMSFLKNSPDLKWVYSDERWLKNNQLFNKKNQHCKFAENIFENSVERCFIGASTVVMAREIFNEVGYFNESFPVCEDYDLWLRASHQYPIGFISEELIIKHGGHNDQLSTKYKAMDYWRVKSSASMFVKVMDNKKKLAIKNFINKKAPILIHGFEKYNAPEKAKEIQSIQSSLSAL